jgi:hypothetical protein
VHKTISIEYLRRLFQAETLTATPLVLPKSKNTVEILTLLRHEQLWTRSPPASFGSVPNKPALQFEGQPTWAEIILLRLLERDGWSGAWVKNWGRRAFWRDVLEVVELPQSAHNIFSRIEKRVGGRGSGCWDIFAWHEDEYLFVESKQHKRDQIRPTQLNWIESALEEGMPISSFVIVEWAR